MPDMLTVLRLSVPVRYQECEYWGDDNKPHRKTLPVFEQWALPFAVNWEWQTEREIWVEFQLLCFSLHIWNQDYKKGKK